MKGLAIDRERAVKAGAACGLALLAITVLPGLLRAPEPPPLPSDVGFRRSEPSPAVLPVPEPEQTRIRNRSGRADRRPVRSRPARGARGGRRTGRRKGGRA